MKHFLLAICLAFAMPFAGPVGCQQAPSVKTVEYQSLLTVGTAAKAGMDAATVLLKQGQITVPQWQKVATFFDTKWQPTYAVAVSAARADLSTVASPDVLALATQFAQLVASLTTK